MSAQRWICVVPAFLAKEDYINNLGYHSVETGIHQACISGLYLSVGSRVKYPPIIEKDPTILEVTKKKKKKKM